MHYKLETYTPASARKLIAHTDKAREAKIVIDQKSNSVFNQRALSPTTVKKYVEAFTSKKWHAETGEAIKLAKWDGGYIILDGQHRLAAVDAYGGPVSIWTAYDVPLSAFPFMDQGVARSAADILTSLSWQDAQLFATVGRLWYREELGGDPRQLNDQSRCTEAVIADYIGPMQPRLYTLRDKYNTSARKAVRAGLGAHRPGLLYSLFRAHQINPEKAEAVADYLADTRGKFAPPHSVWSVWAEAMGNPKPTIGLVAEVNRAKKLGHPAVTNSTLCALVVTAFPIAWNYMRNGGRRPSLGGLKNQIRNALPGAFSPME